jgi:hypothetical protein
MRRPVFGPGEGRAVFILFPPKFESARSRAAEGSFLAMGIEYGVLGLLILVLDIIALVSILGGRSSVEHKLLWTLLVLFLPVVGMILYFLIGQSRRDL